MGERAPERVNAVIDIWADRLAKRPANEKGEPLCSECNGVIAEGYRHCVCEGCNERFRLESEERERRLTRQRVVSEVAQGFNRSVPPVDFARLNNPEFVQAISKSPKIRAAVEKWTPDKLNLALLAPTGRYKTLGARALVHRLVGEAVNQKLADPKNDRLARVVRGLHWCAAYDLANARRRHGLGEGEAPALDDAKRASMLIVDELGFESQHDGSLFEVFDGLYLKGVPIIITSGLRPAEIAARYGDAFWRRIAERGTVVEEFV